MLVVDLVNACLFSQIVTKASFCYIATLPLFGRHGTRGWFRAGFCFVLDRQKEFFVPLQFSQERGNCGFTTHEKVSFWVNSYAQKDTSSCVPREVADMEKNVVPVIGNIRDFKGVPKSWRIDPFADVRPFARDATTIFFISIIRQLKSFARPVLPIFSRNRECPGDTSIRADFTHEGYLEIFLILWICRCKGALTPARVAPLWRCFARGDRYNERRHDRQRVFQCSDDLGCCHICSALVYVLQEQNSTPIPPCLR